MTQQIASALALVLKQHESEIAASWAAKIDQIPDSRYHQLPPEELHGSIRRGKAAIAEALSTGSYARLDAYLTDVSLARLQAGFSIGEVIEALLLCKDAVLPVVWRAWPAGSATLQEAVAYMDACTRWMAGRVAELCTLQADQRRRAQQVRTAMMLDMARTASSSLELDDVIRHVGESIAVVTGAEYCGLFLVDEERAAVQARFDITVPPVLQATLEMGLNLPAPLQPLTAYSEFLGQVVAQRKPNSCYDVQTDPRFEGSFPRATGFRSLLAVPFVLHERVVAVAYALTFDAYRTFSEDEIEMACGLADVTALAVDNARLFEQVRERLDESQSLQRVTSALLQELRLEEVLDIVCNEAGRLTNSRDSAIFFLQDRDWLQIAFNVEGRPLVERIPVEGTRSGTVVRTGQPIVINDTASDQGLYRRGGLPARLLIVPLSVKGKAIGTLTLVDKPHDYTDDDMRITNLLANQAAIAIENARLYRRVKELAICEERDRLAREMHDNLSQMLGTVNWRASTVDRLLSEGHVEQARESLQELKAAAKQGYRDARQTIYALRSSAAVGQEFLPALEEYLQEYRAHYGLDIALIVDDQPFPQLPVEVRLQIIRIVQEALSNAGQHSGAQQVWVRSRQEGGCLQISIEDEGRGFDPAAVEGQNRHRFGLLTMRERAAGVGGTLEIEAQPGRGTRVVLKLPLADGDGDRADE